LARFIVKQPSSLANPSPASAHTMQTQALQNVRHGHVRVSGYEQQCVSGAALEVSNIKRLLDRFCLYLPAPIRAG
jgi:hypothetical protein